MGQAGARPVPGLWLILLLPETPAAPGPGRTPGPRSTAGPRLRVPPSPPFPWTNPAPASRCGSGTSASSKASLTAALGPPRPELGPFPGVPPARVLLTQGTLPAPVSSRVIGASHHSPVCRVAQGLWRLEGAERGACASHTSVVLTALLDTAGSVRVENEARGEAGRGLERGRGSGLFQNCSQGLPQAGGAVGSSPGLTLSSGDREPSLAP